MPVVISVPKPAVARYGKILFVFSVTAWFLALFTVPGMGWPWLARFETNDDYWMMSIASGNYTGRPSEFILYPHTIIGKLLSIGFAVWPGMNANVLLLCLLHLGFAATIVRVLFRRQSPNLAWVLVCGAVIIFQLYVYLRLQFTTSAFVGATAGVVLLLDAPSVRSAAGRRTQQIIAALLWILGYLVRKQAAGLAVVLAFPAIVAAWRKEAAGARREMIVIALFLFLAALSLEAGDRWYVGRYPEWKAFSSFNRDRGRMHVAPGYAYDAKTAPVYDAVGWSANDVRIFQQWFFPDSRVHAPQDVAYIVQHLRRSTAMKPVLHSWWHDIALTNRFVFAAMALACFGAALEGLWCGAVAWATGLLSLVLQLFFFATARLPERILWPLCFAPLLFSLPFWTGVNSAGFRQVTHLTWCIGMVLMCVWGVRRLIRLDRQHREMASAWQVAQQQENRCRAQLLVLWADDWPVEWAPIGFRRSSPGRPARYLSLSSLCQSPHNATILERHGITNVVNALIDRDDVLLICREERWPLLQQYLREHYGINAARTDWGGLFSRRIWKISRIAENHE